MDFIRCEMLKMYKWLSLASNRSNLLGHRIRDHRGHDHHNLYLRQNSVSFLNIFRKLLSYLHQDHCHNRRFRRVHDRILLQDHFRIRPGCRFLDSVPDLHIRLRCLVLSDQYQNKQALKIGDLMKNFEKLTKTTIAETSVTSANTSSDAIAAILGSSHGDDGEESENDEGFHFGLVCWFGWLVAVSADDWMFVAGWFQQLNDGAFIWNWSSSDGALKCPFKDSRERGRRRSSRGGVCVRFLQPPS